LRREREGKGKVGEEREGRKSGEKMKREEWVGLLP